MRNGEVAQGGMSICRIFKQRWIFVILVIWDMLDQNISDVIIERVMRAWVKG